MTHVPEIGAINRLHFGFFWRRLLVSALCKSRTGSSGTRFRRRL